MWLACVVAGPHLGLLRPGFCWQDPACCAVDCWAAMHLRLAPQSLTTVGLGCLLPGTVGALTRNCTCSWCASSCDGVVRRSCDAFRYTLAAAATPVQQVMGCGCTLSITAPPYSRLAAEPDTQNTLTWSLLGSHTCMARLQQCSGYWGAVGDAVCWGCGWGLDDQYCVPWGMEVHSCALRQGGLAGWVCTF